MQLQFGDNVLGGGAEVLGHALANRVQGLSSDGDVIYLPSRAALRFGAAFDQR